MRLRNIAIILTGIVSGTASCVKQQLETTYTSQEKKIDQYIEQNRVSNGDTLRVVYNGGSSRLVRIEGEGQELSSEGTIAFYYAGYVFNGNKNASGLFITNHEETAKAAGWNLTDENYSIYQINMSDVRLIDGLRSGLLGVKSGEHCQILFSGKYGFGNESFGIIPANSALLYEIWVEAVSND